MALTRPLVAPPWPTNTGAIAAASTASGPHFLRDAATGDLTLQVGGEALRLALGEDGYSVTLPGEAATVVASPSLDELLAAVRAAGAAGDADADTDDDQPQPGPSTLVCGRGDKGQLGTGPFTVVPSAAPLAAGPLTHLPPPLRQRLRFVKVSLGDAHAVGLTAHGAAFAWGSGMSGALGLGPSRHNRPVPTEIAGCCVGYRLVDVAAGASHTLLVADGGEVLSCGRGDRGQLGTGDGASPRTPQPVDYFRRRRERLLAAAAAAAGESDTNGGSGAVGGGGGVPPSDDVHINDDTSDTPAAARALQPSARKRPLSQPSTPLATLDSPSPAGDSASSPDGDGEVPAPTAGGDATDEAPPPSTPARPAGWSGVNTADALVLDSISRHHHVGAATHSGSAVRQSAFKPHPAPSPLTAGGSGAASALSPPPLQQHHPRAAHDAKRRRRGSSAGFAATADGGGDDDDVHEHGHEHPADAAAVAAEAPAPPPAPTCDDDVLRVYAGGDTSFAVTARGAVFAWGASDRGQTGTGARGDVPQPMPVQDLRAEAVTAVAAGPEHALFVTASGALYAAGSASWGKLGLGREARDRHAPLRVGGALEGRRVVAAAAGANHSLAVADDGALFAWGDNSGFQLGTASTGHGSYDRASVRPVADSLVPPAFLPDVPPPAIGHREAWEPARVVGGLAGQRVRAVAAGSTHSLAVTTDGAAWVWGKQSGSYHLCPVDGAGLATLAARVAAAAAAAAADGDEAAPQQLPLSGDLPTRLRAVTDAVGKGTIKLPHKLKLPARVRGVAAGPQASVWLLEDEPAPAVSAAGVAHRLPGVLLPRWTGLTVTDAAPSAPAVLSASRVFSLGSSTVTGGGISVPVITASRSSDGMGGHPTSEAALVGWPQPPREKPQPPPAPAPEADLEGGAGDGVATTPEGGVPDGAPSPIASTGSGDGAATTSAASVVGAFSPARTQRLPPRYPGGATQQLPPAAASSPGTAAAAAAPSDSAPPSRRGSDADAAMAGGSAPPSRRSSIGTIGTASTTSAPPGDGEYYRNLMDLSLSVELHGMTGGGSGEPHAHEHAHAHHHHYEHAHAPHHEAAHGGGGGEIQLPSLNDSGAMAGDDDGSEPGHVMAVGRHDSRHQHPTPAAPMLGFGGGADLGDAAIAAAAVAAAALAAGGDAGTHEPQSAHAPHSAVPPDAGVPDWGAPAAAAPAHSKEVTTVLTDVASLAATGVPVTPGGAADTNVSSVGDDDDEGFTTVSIAEGSGGTSEAGEPPAPAASAPKPATRPRMPSQPVRVVSYANLHAADDGSGADGDGAGSCWSAFLRALTCGVLGGRRR
jgi:alpha-tubulin suppressor-like RCC1 family protein